jgi:hypothetical protein
MAEGNPDIDLEDAPKLNTPALEALLRQKYQRDRYALFFDVPDAVSLDARRRIDAVAIGIWKSVGREVQAFELKVSRSDWLRELKNVDKADPFIAICDRFWLVTGDPSVAKLDEIPACWGWMTASKHGLRVQRPAEKLPTDRANMPWGFTIGLLRKLQDNLLASPDVRAEIDRQVKELTSRQDERVRWAKEEAERNAKDLREAVAKFEAESGLSIRRWGMGNVGTIVKHLQKLGYGDGLNQVPNLLEGHANVLRITLERVEEARAALAALPPLGAEES